MTILEHIRLFNVQDTFKNENIITKVNYAILAYNNTRHSVTKFTPFEIINGHLEINNPTNIDIEHQLINQYNQSHHDKIKLLYEQVHENIQSNKNKIIGERNKNREELPDIPSEIIVKNKQKCNKTKNKFKKEKLKEINTQLKTGKLETQTPQKTENIHLSNIKRPLKTTKFQSIPGPSSKSDNRQ